LALLPRHSSGPCRDGAPRFVKPLQLPGQAGVVIALGGLEIVEWSRRRGRESGGPRASLPLGGPGPQRGGGSVSHSGSGAAHPAGT